MSAIVYQRHHGTKHCKRHEYCKTLNYTYTVCIFNGFDYFWIEIKKVLKTE